MAADETIEVHVAYALPARQWVEMLRVPVGSTAIEVVRESGIRTVCPEIQWETVKLGVFGRRVPFDYVVAAGDRVEVCRALIADPKTVRRERARRPNAGSARMVGS